MNRLVFKAHTFFSLRGFSLSPPVAPLWGGEGEGEQCVIAAGVNQSQEEGEGRGGDLDWCLVSAAGGGEKREERLQDGFWQLLPPPLRFPYGVGEKGKEKGKWKKKLEHCFEGGQKN